jgi:hypothetical protein
MLVSSGHVHVRVVTRKNKTGTPVRYLQLAHNEWDATTKTSRPKVLHSFGREDALDRAAIERLVASLCRLLEPGCALAAKAGPELAFVSSRAFGGAYVLDALWQRLNIGAVLAKLLGTTRRDPTTERVLFALVANRALAPSSKLAATGWVGRQVHIAGLPETSEDACYRAMDWLHEVTEELTKEIFWQVATLLDLHVDLLFFDTTSIYFELEEADGPVSRDEHGTPTGAVEDTTEIGFRTYGNSQRQ